MYKINQILAKSKANGGITLIDHIQHVSAIAIKTAEVLNINKRLAIYGAYLHDIGKSNPIFQDKLRGKSDNNEMDFRHEISSILFLPNFPEELWDELIDLVIAHHRSPKNDLRKQGIIDLVNLEGEEEVFQRHAEIWEDWSPVSFSILRKLGINIRKTKKEDAYNAFNYTLEQCESKPLGWSKLKGMLIGSDHLASAMAEKSFNISKKLFDIPNTSFFNSQDRKSKVYPLSLVSSEDSRKHTIVVAPTGAGKTDFLINRCNNRIFYTLPFQASINSMYQRLKDSCPDETDIRILHAASSIVFNNNSYEEKALQPMIGAAIKVLTPHQLAALICGTRGFESIAIDIEGCDVILDEIHSYSEIAQSMVIEIIKVLQKLNCKIHIGTATMPTALVNEIDKLLGGDDNVYFVELSEKDLNTFNRHKIFKHSEDESTNSIIEDAIAKNEKILIVCNRIDNAHRKFTELKRKYNNVPIMLIHSRFRRVDRAYLEQQLHEYYNNRKIMPEGCIVVSTQVVEVSLDISFDLMITEAAPIDSLIQRFGRINRYRTPESLKHNIIKSIHVIAPPDNAKLCLPYKKEIVDKSFEYLPDGDMFYERDVQKSIDKVYPEVKILPIDVHLAWDNGQFLLKELTHLPKANLLEMLNIESATCIRHIDLEHYEKSNREDRLALEISIPRSALFKKITHYGYSNFGNKPLIIDDQLYDYELGLQLKEIDSFI